MAKFWSSRTMKSFAPSCDKLMTSFDRLIAPIPSFGTMAWGVHEAWLRSLKGPAPRLLSDNVGFCLVHSHRSWSLTHRPQFGFPSSHFTLFWRHVEQPEQASGWAGLKNHFDRDWTRLTTLWPTFLGSGTFCVRSLRLCSLLHGMMTFRGDNWKVRIMNCVLQQRVSFPSISIWIWVSASRSISNPINSDTTSWALR